MKISRLIDWWRSEGSYHRTKADEKPHRTQKANAQHAEYHHGQADALERSATELENSL